MSIRAAHSAVLQLYFCVVYVAFIHSFLPIIFFSGGRCYGVCMVIVWLLSCMKTLYYFCMSSADVVELFLVVCCLIIKICDSDKYYYMVLT